MEDLEQKIKERLLEDLIDKMGDQSGGRLKPKALSVEVAAPNKSKLAQGLDKAKSVLGALPSGSEDEEEAPGGDLASHSSQEDEDEQRLLELLGHGSDDEDEEDAGLSGRR